MKAKNRNYLNLSNILLCISIVIIIIMAIYINKLSNELNSLKADIETKNASDNSSNSDSNQKNDDEEIVGIWKTFEAIDSQTGEKTQNLTKIFGSSYLSFGSTLKLNEDGTFLDSIYPITSNEVSVEGIYRIKRDLYNPGDCYILLTYTDKTEKKFILTYYVKWEI